MDNVEFRRANIFDIDLIIKMSEIYVKETFYYTNSISDIHNYIGHYFNYKKIEKELTDDKSYYYLVEYKNRIVGYFKLNEYENRTLFLDNLDNYFQIQRIILASEVKSRGIEEEIIKKALQQAENLKYKNVIVDFNENDKANITTFLNEGFKKFFEFEQKLFNQKRRNIILLKEI